MLGKLAPWVGQRLAKVSVLGIIIGMTASCSPPAQRLDNAALESGFSRQLVRGREFSHVAYRNSTAAAGQVLHVYLEGDGIPWIAHRWESRDPTPDDPLMLRLMALDPGPSLYLGRPCYNGLAETAPCHPALWTSARYSKRVVVSMATVLEGIVAAENIRSVVLIGHSGGGTLAMLLADQVPRVQIVVTLAGNLDPDAWTALHGFSPLTESLNPAREPPLDADIHQLHLLAGRDTNIPPMVIEEALVTQQNPEVIVLDTFDHTCCWSTIWPEVLHSIALGTPFRG